MQTKNNAGRRYNINLISEEYQIYGNAEKSWVVYLKSEIVMLFSYYYIHMNKIIFYMKINTFNPQKFGNKLKQ